MAEKKYRKYPEAVRLQIVKARNPYLFPELEIPRTTANSWIKTALTNQEDPPTEASLLDRRIKKLELELSKATALNDLVVVVRGLFPYSFREKKVPTKSIRKQIIDAILLAAKKNRIGECLSIIGLSKNTYSRWLSEFFLCESLEKICFQRRPHQLTIDEIKIMKKLLTCRRFSHFSIVSLCLWAQRDGQLVCSVDSWYKYLRIFGWVRPRLKIKTKIEKTGLRTHRPNEVWHIDVTEVKTLTKKKVYIQVISDNFSRFVLAWRVTKDISALNTVALIEDAKTRSVNLLGEWSDAVMSDGGPENRNHRVLNFLTASNVKRLIARVDIRFSNSMIESVFRQLKSNFLSSEKLRNQKDVERKVDFFFKEYNEVIPKLQIAGATPKESFLGQWTDEKNLALKAKLESAKAERKSNFRNVTCPQCVN